jgi:hypothetical protein
VVLTGSPPGDRDGREQPGHERLPLAGLVAFSHLQSSQIRGRQPYLIVRKILYVIASGSLEVIPASVRGPCPLTILSLVTSELPPSRHILRFSENYCVNAPDSRGRHLPQTQLLGGATGFSIVARKGFW